MKDGKANAFISQNVLLKAFGHKYIRKIPKKNGKGFWYIYKETFKKPFQALAQIFGIKRERVSSDYEKHEIQKNYGVSKKTFAAHVLEYFTNRLKWDTIFSKEENREKYKKPQKPAAPKDKTGEAGKMGGRKRTGGGRSRKKKPTDDAIKVNRSLMYKVWSIYSAEGQRVEGEEKKEAASGKNQADAIGGRVSGSAKEVRNGWSGASGGANVPDAGNGDNGGQPELGSDKPRVGLGNADGNVFGGRGRVTKAEAKKIREQCREILKKSDEEITEAEKDILRQYVGAGGTDEEGMSNSGALYEFYTPHNVINKVWQLVDKYNPRQDKTVIEPSAGIGRFAEGRLEKFALFELEEESARIARILHPEAEVVQGAFQENFIKNKGGRFTKEFEKFDVAVGNPPYGKYAGKYKGLGEGKEFSRYESYFMARTLDTLKDGGIMAMVVPSGFLDSKEGGRTYGKDLEKIAGKAELLEAWRLPNGTFDTTDIGTDIVILRKGKGGRAEDFRGYFEKNPSHIAGEVATRTGRFGKEETYIKVKSGETFESAIDKIDAGQAEKQKRLEAAVSKIAARRKSERKAPAGLGLGDEIETARGKAKITGFIKNKGKIAGYITRVNGETEEIRIDGAEKESEEEKRRNRSEAMRGNKNAYKGGPKEEEKAAQAPAVGAILSAEEFNKKYGKNINAADLPIWKAADKYGNVDLTKLTDAEKEYVENSGEYVNSGGVYAHKVIYASGNIREKLKNLDESDPQYEMKKALLTEAMPPEKKIGQFTLSPITDWARDYKTAEGITLLEGFLRWAYNGNRSFVASDSPISPEELPPEISFSDIEDFIWRVPVRLKRSEKEDDKKANSRLKFRKKEKRQEAAIRLFNRYLQEGLTKEEQAALVSDWNDNFNTYKSPDYTKIPIFVDGMSTHKGGKEFTLTEQQVKGITQLTTKGSGLLAYDVGVGKTVTGIVATVNQIQTGRSKKPLICVPKAVYKSWVDSIHEHFPGIKVNELGNLSRNFVGEDVKIEEGSISVCTYEGLENIAFNGEEEAILKEDLEFGALYEAEEDKKSKREKAKAGEKREEVVGAMLKTRDGGIQFSDLGFDHITVDEVHNFRSLFAMPRRIARPGEQEDGKKQANEFGALSGGRSSRRAQKLFGITRLIQEKNEGRNVFLLSATPFQNSPTEIYSILSYMARDKMKALGIYSLEQFVGTFCRVQSEYVVKAATVEEKQVMKDFNNLAALQNLITEYIDKVDGEEAGVVRPYKRTHTPELEMTALQKAIMTECEDYIALEETKPADERAPGYMFRAMNAMRNCALSPALVSDDFIPEGMKRPPMSEIVESSPKLKFVCDSIVKQYKQNSQNGQVMYMPSGVEQFPQVQAYLVRRGVPKDAIELMRGDGTSDKAMDERQAIMDEFNDVNGKCKIIIGSGVIKEGVNLNGNSTVIYNTQLDWNPTDAQQVEGRIWRQGNRQGITHVVYPLMRDSIDSMIYQKYDEKGSRLDALFNYKGDTLNVADIDPEELKFGLIKDPAKRAKMQTTQFKEKAQGDRKMYAQLIDVLHRQAEIAFKSDARLKQESGADNLADWEEDYKTALAQKKEAPKARKILEEAYGSNMDGYSLDEAKRLLESNGITSIELYGGWSGGRGQSAYASALTQLRQYDSEERIPWFKKRIDEVKKTHKKLVAQRESVRAALEAKGMRTIQDVEARKEEYDRLMSEAAENERKADDMYEKFYEAAVADNKAQQKTVLSVDELVEENVSSIMNDLHPMDDEWRAKIKAENEARFGKKVKKSMWLWIDANGKIWVKKSVLKAWKKAMSE